MIRKLNTQSNLTLKSCHPSSYFIKTDIILCPLKLRVAICCPVVIPLENIFYDHRTMNNLSHMQTLNVVDNLHHDWRESKICVFAHDAEDVFNKKSQYFSVGSRLKVIYD
jgi:hypothetical protein